MWELIDMFTRGNQQIYAESPNHTKRQGMPQREYIEIELNPNLNKFLKSTLKNQNQRHFDSVCASNNLTPHCIKPVY